MNLANKEVVIVGASGGIGSTLARILKAEGAKLVAIGRNAKRLNEFSNKQYVCDLSNSENVKKSTEKLKQDLSKIDVLVHAAGVAGYKNFEDITLGELNEAFEINTKAPFFMTQQLLPLLQKSKHSLVLNIGSGAGTIPMKGRSLYCGTKFALRGMTLALSEEFEGRNPDFVLVTLGSTLTEFGPMTLTEKRKEAKKGKAYFPVEWVANKLVEIIKDDKRETEYVLFPSGYGFGEWKKA